MTTGTPQPCRYCLGLRHNCSACGGTGMATYPAVNIQYVNPLIIVKRERDRNGHETPKGKR